MINDELKKEIGEKIVEIFEDKIDKITTEKANKLENIKLIINNEMNQVSDGYHTFDELYFHRLILFSVICQQNKEKAWRSKLHADGTMFDYYFIVGITTPEGEFTYHYELKHWDKFIGIKELDKAPEWDGHVANDVTRLFSLLKK